MAKKVDSIKLGDPFLDRRTKLLPCQKEMVHFWYGMGASIHSLSRMFKVDRRLIQFLLFPERQRKNLSDRQDRGGSAVYYDKVKHGKAVKSCREYKDKLFPNND